MQQKWSVAIIAGVLLALCSCSKSAPPPSVTSDRLVESRPASESQKAPETRAEPASKPAALSEPKTDPSLFEAIQENRPYWFRGALVDEAKHKEFHFILRLVRSQNRLEGNYTYRNKTYSIALSGTIDPDGNFVLKERASGKETGEWKGQWSIDNGFDSSSTVFDFSGDWNSIPLGKTLTISHVSSLQISPSADTKELKIYEKSFGKEATAETPEKQVVYLSFEGTDKARWRGLNQAMEKLVFKELEAKKMLADAELTEFSGTTELIQLSDRLAVILATYEGMGELAAHPFHGTNSINYDLKNQKKLNLQDLFTSQAYLKKIANHCREELKKQEELTFEDGAAPKAENFQTWTINPDGITIRFQEYQVGPYVAGTPEVFISLETLESWKILKPEMRKLWP